MGPPPSHSNDHDPASSQLLYRLPQSSSGGIRSGSSSSSMLLTASNGAPVDSLTASLTAGGSGPILLQDFVLIDHLSKFDRERIPERVVHAKGAGAFGYFEATDPFVPKICKAALFAPVGKRTPVAVRFSTVGGESGSPDTARDPRGFAIKFYTEEGNWDLVGNNTPIFFLRDPILFPSFIHTQKRNPATHLADPDMFWDFMGLRPETVHQASFLFSDRGTPNGYRHMNGYGSHAFKNVNASGEAVYVKYHFKTDQGISNLSADQAQRLAAQDPDYATRDLYNAIARGDYPSWTLYVQVMTFDEAKSVPFNPFDLTKVWPHSQFPLQRAGRLVLNRNPDNYFAEIEQLAFAPSHMVPGIEPSPDKMLQARLFSYPDTHRHRLGPNYANIPVNQPLGVGSTPASQPQHGNYQRDGPMQTTANGGGGPNYFPNSFDGPAPSTKGELARYPLQGDVARVETGDEDNFSQCRDFFTAVLSDAERDRLTTNVAAHMSKVRSDTVQKRALENLYRVHPEYGRAVEHKVRDMKQRAQQERPAMGNDNIAATRLSPPRDVPPKAGPAQDGAFHATESRCPYGYSSKL